MNREEMIAELVEKIVSDIMECEPALWIEDRLFCGYSQMTDQEIEQEYRETFLREVLP